MAWLFSKLEVQQSEIADQLAPILTHVLLKDTEKRVVKRAVASLKKKDKEEGDKLLDQIHYARSLKNELINLDEQISSVNSRVAEAAETVEEDMDESESQLRQRCQQLAHLVNISEREYRFFQVRQHIASEILAKQVPN